MVFKKLSINDVGSYQAKDERLLKAILRKHYEKTQGPMEDIFQRMEDCLLTGKKYKPFKRDKYFIVRDFITCLALCHNVTPTLEDGVRTFQASSPDEIALVKIAESLGLILGERTLK
jgi:phospholipid-translocating ATPase